MRAPLQSVSKTIAFSLVLLAAPAGAETLTMGGTGTALALAQMLGDAYTVRHPEVTIDIPPSVGSGGGIRALMAGQFGVSFSVRPLTAQEKEQGAIAEPLCRTPFVLAVSEEVGGNLSLTSANVLDIFARKTTTWPDGTTISLVYRTPSETGAALLEARIPGLSELFQQGREARGAIVAYSDQEMMNIGERNAGSLVFGALVAVRAEKRRLRAIPFDGVTPSIDSVTDGSYPLEFVLHTVLGRKSGETARRFQNFTKSEDAKAIMRNFACAPFAAKVPPQPGEITPRGQREQEGEVIAEIPMDQY